MKICRICGKLKELNKFYKCKLMKNGYRNECKECSKILYVDKGKIREKNLKQKIKNEGYKTCRICNVKKHILEFNIKRGNYDGRRHECKECMKKIQKKYKELPDFIEKRKEYDKKRYEEKKEKILKRKKEYYLENRDKLLEYKEHYRIEKQNIIKKWRKDNKYRLSELQKDYRQKYPHVISWRSILHSTIKRIGTKKSSKTIEILGYSADDLKKHMEKLFESGMSWSNHGKWHIDHIKPVTKFTINTPISEVCALSNLQPLWKKDNLSKNNKFVL